MQFILAGSRPVVQNDSMSRELSKGVSKRSSQRAKIALMAKLLEGLDSGKPIAVGRKYFTQKKNALVRKHGEGPL